jgi:CheY-like chemotaxis protein
MILETKPKVILMADDDEDDRLLAQDALREAWPEGNLRFVQNGEELLDYLHQRGPYAAAENAPRPGLILLDLNMPRKGGCEALREIKAEPNLRRIPVVIFTTSKADTDIASMYELGASSFIAKPFQFEELVKLMRMLAGYWFNTVILPVSN